MNKAKRKPSYECPWCGVVIGEQVEGGILWTHHDLPHPEDAVFSSGYPNSRHVSPLPSKRHEN